MMQPNEPPKPRVPYMRQMAIVMELPFTLAGPILFGALAGGILDHYLGTSPWLLLLLLALGFAAGIRELARRMKALDGPRGGGDERPSR